MWAPKCSANFILKFELGSWSDLKLKKRFSRENFEVYENNHHFLPHRFCSSFKNRLRMEILNKFHYGKKYGKIEQAA